MKITNVTAADYDEIDMVIHAAFENTEHGYHQEAEIVHAIRTESSFNQQLEVVARRDGLVVGHAMLSEIKVVGSNLTWYIILSTLWLSAS
ncbi:GNAT family N-acetyltransferase [Paucilactobacillus kaifaensis]|uniref:GNAT family N-acetyltransferase n=1 Tax=Paucilactobacillus kaifaensis TaxID=2559921 RepID=UPI0010F482E9|nr:hypothetical protein [Paucilactobacillus kaifaensis]